MQNTHAALLSNKYDCNVGPQQERFLARNHVAPTYKGPVFVVEDVWVPCSHCRAPVDPVVRIPVGKLVFHPQCLRCVVCQRPSRTDMFHSVGGQPVCHDCGNRGFDRSVKKTLQQQRIALRLQQRSVSRERSAAGSVTPRRALSPASPSGSPSPAPLAIGAPRCNPASPFLDSRAITRRQKELLDRQRAVVEGDRNILFVIPPSLSVASTVSPMNHMDLRPSTVEGSRPRGTRGSSISIPPTPVFPQIGAATPR